MRYPFFYQAAEMSSTEPVNIAGLIQGFLAMGFTTSHVISEIIDDIFGAGATSAIFSINTQTHELLVIDNAKGMTKDELVLSHRLFNHSEASDEKQGRFGIGSKVAKVHLTQYQGETIVISKVADSDTIHQITIDWKRAATQGILELIATEASSKNETLWQHHCRIQGTVMRIMLGNKIENEILVKINDGSLIQYLSRMYANDLSTKSITFKIDGTEFPLIALDLLDEKATVPVRKKTTVEIWQNPERGCRIYFHNGNNEKVWFTGATPGREPPNGYTLHGKILIESAAACNKSPIVTEHSNGNPTWGYWKTEDGGIFIRRLNKIVEKLHNDEGTAGDAGKRRIHASSRHIVTFNSGLDDYFGVMINKSQINKQLIHATLADFIFWYTKDFSIKVYESANNEYKKNEATKIAFIDEQKRKQKEEQDKAKAGKKSIVDVFQQTNLDIIVPVNPNPPVPKKKETKTVNINPIKNGTSISIECSDKRTKFIEHAGAPDALEEWLQAYLKKYGVEALMKLVANLP